MQRERSARRKCLETSAGFYVPVDDESGRCGWVLYFVPRAGDAVRLRSDLFEGEFEFTIYFAVDDMDADGFGEVVLGRRAEHPEGVSFGNAFTLLSPGPDATLPFDELRDVDGDSRIDGLLDFSATEGDFLCVQARNPDSQDVWATVDLRAPSIVAHRLERRRFHTDGCRRSTGARESVCDIERARGGRRCERSRRRISDIEPPGL